MTDIKLIIFDMDGLLVDSETHYSIGWQEAVREVGYHIDQNVANSWIGQGKQKTIEYLMDLIGKVDVVDTIVDLREAYIYKMLDSGRILEKPYASETLKTLHHQGYKIGVASSTHRKRALAILKYLDLEQYIDYACFGDDVQQVKPDPQVYLKVLNYFKYPIENVLAVEDSKTGTQAALNAGLRTLVVPSTDLEKEQILMLNSNVNFSSDLRGVFQYT